MQQRHGCASQKTQVVWLSQGSFRGNRNAKMEDTGKYELKKICLRQVYWRNSPHWRCTGEKMSIFITKKRWFFFFTTEPQDYEPFKRDFCFQMHIFAKSRCTGETFSLEVLRIRFLLDPAPEPEPLPKELELLGSGSFLESALFWVCTSLILIQEAHQCAFMQSELN